MLCRPSQSPPLFSSWHNPRMNGIHYERRKGECGISSITRRLLALLTAAAVLWAPADAGKGRIRRMCPRKPPFRVNPGRKIAPPGTPLLEGKRRAEASRTIPRRGAARLKAGFRTVPLLEGRLRETRPPGSPRQTIRRRVPLHRIIPPRKSHWKSSTRCWDRRRGPAGQDRGQTPNRAELRRVGRLVVYRYR